ncbi:ComEC/Rec2-related protein [Nocardia amikacinitolerans]|uniref:ComEC/Rec2 family competence protein n=1 Tax=Nocardia amikacinitolerans TaxID=756689 RepID=UPI0020A3B6E1|nr:ComEC/Rec2 family competence protein [Nocardia amikacinitolerans]MCP2297402.1 ComEC/Rec2-related protein [Nocardia amikacinitolerans]
MTSSLGSRAPESAERSRIVDARLLPAALCCWGVTIVVLVSGWLVGIAVALGSAVAAAGLAAMSRQGRFTRAKVHRAVASTVLAAVLLGAGFALAAAWRDYRVATHPMREAYGLSMRIVVTPTDDPKPLPSNGFGGERRWVVRAALREYHRADARVHSGGRVVVFASGREWGELLPGQPIEFRAQPQPPKNRDLTVAALHALGPPKPVAAPPWWQRAAASVRNDFADTAAAVLPEDAAGLIPALVLGDTSGLPEPVREDFKTAGLQHLCVVSGANFTILLTVVLFVVRTLTLGPRAAATAATAALVMFVVVARPDPSVLRAAAMGAITLLALVTGRRKQALPALCAAVIGLLLVWPELAVNAGFALSVLATAGLILLAPSWADWLRARGWWRLPAEVVAVSAAAFTVTVPIMVALTGRISVVAILANVLVAPVIAPLTVVGALGAACASVWPPVAELVLRCAGPPLWWLLTVAERTAALPGATITVPGGSIGGLTAAAFVLVAVSALRIALVRRITVVIVLSSTAVLLPVRLWSPGWPPSDWVLAACDIGQGDGLALSVGRGTAIVIDVGPDPRTMRTCLDRLRIHHIALLALTHPHADHIGGLTGAIHGRTVTAIAIAPGELDHAATPTHPAAKGIERQSSPRDKPIPEKVSEPETAHPLPERIVPRTIPINREAQPLVMPGGRCDDAALRGGEVGGVASCCAEVALRGGEVGSGPCCCAEVALEGGEVGGGARCCAEAAPGGDEIGGAASRYAEAPSAGGAMGGHVARYAEAALGEEVGGEASCCAGAAVRGDEVGSGASCCAGAASRGGEVGGGACCCAEAALAGGEIGGPASLYAEAALRGDEVGGGATRRTEAAPGGGDIGSGPATQRPPAPDDRTPITSVAQIAEIAARAEIPILELSAGHVMQFGPVELTVLSPSATHPRPRQPADEPNDRSLVLTATTPAGRILLTGDIESSAQLRLLRNPPALRADILKVPHHGSQTTTKEFLTAVHPRLAIISSGANNTFGHPHPKILTTLHALGTTIARTDHHGDILITGTPPHLHILTRRPG